MLLNKKQLFFRDLFRSRKMLSWLKKICWILFFLLCMIKLYAQSEVIPCLFTTYQQNGRILWVIPDTGNLNLADGSEVSLGREQ